MTKEFYTTDWKPKEGRITLKIDILDPLEDDMPMIQVYFYAKEAVKRTAVLIEIKQTAYIKEDNSIELIHGEPFDGCIVIR